MFLGLPLHTIASGVSSTARPGTPARPDLSEERWLQIARLVESFDATAMPWTSATLRPTVQALLYQSITDTAWYALPAWAPAAVELRATYDRWQNIGLLRRLSTLLSIQLDVPAGPAQP